MVRRLAPVTYAIIVLVPVVGYTQNKGQHAIRPTTDHMIVARVPISAIRNEKAYRFFAGLDDDGDPLWTTDFEQRRPVLTDTEHCYRPEVEFNPGIGRYLLLTATSGAPRWAGTDEKYLGVFESSTPRGPWHKVKQIHGWGGDES